MATQELRVKTKASLGEIITHLESLVACLKHGQICIRKGEKHIITYPACVFIPKGTLHGPLNVKRVTKPLMFIDITLSPGYSIRPMPAGTEARKP